MQKSAWHLGFSTLAAIKVILSRKKVSRYDIEKVEKQISGLCYFTTGPRQGKLQATAVP